ncbi:hypothetical protein SSX86_031602, partial [Deinandra increscens subsp. villosa]
MKQVLFEQVIGPTVKLLTRHITRRLGHVICTTKQLTHMAERMNHLNSICKDVESHNTANVINMREVPIGVAGWLTEVEKVKEKVESISINDQGIGCLNLKMRYEAGRKASKATETIEKLIIQNSEFVWKDAPIPIGRVNRKPASSFGDVFKSRERPFNDTLKLLQLDDTNSQVIALCGMGGIGKTTMMEQLLRAEEINRIFDCLVKVVIGTDVNILSIQKAVAEYILPEGLVEGTKAGRSSRLHERWKVMLDREKKRILLILDDVWEKFEIKDIGLTSPLPQGVKLLLTSRNSGDCKQFATTADSAIQVVTIDVLEEAEAQILFSRNTGLTEAKNSDLYHIVKKCGGLPLAIKHVASTFKYEEDRVLDGALSRRFSNYYVDEDLYDIMQGVFQLSFDHIGEDEDKMIFLHCGLFPKDYDISIEYLARYAWGLKLLKNVSTFREVRKRTRKCVHSLMDANLLMSSDHLGCVKMHVLVLSFVLGRVSKGDHPTWIINHDDFSNWGSIETNKTTCTRISLTCRRGLSTFPSDFKYPSLSLLQLMNRDMVQFPKYFYVNMETLQVIAYYKMHHPLLPRSLQCSTSLTTLLLHKCTLESNNNYSFVGDLVNLEVLSFAHCGIRKLPSTIGNLKKLKLLDLSGCVDLHIDDGVFRNLHSLEELYMRVVSDDDRKAAIRFTDANWEELKILLLKQLYALEAEFVEKKTRLESVSFSRLEKFKISIGCLLDEEEEEDPFTNTLKIVTSNSKNEILDCQINELFKETEKLHLQVQDMSALENIVPVHSNSYSFCNLRDLTVFNCAVLEYLFPIPIASGLRKLERLKVSSCSVLKTLVCDNGSGSEINSGAGEMMINFEALKFLCLEKLPELVSLFLVDDIVIELPQLVELEVDGLPNFTSISALLNTQVKIGKLEKLKIGHMEKLKQIWTSSSEEEVNNISMLKEIKVVGCDSLVNPFPTNLLGLLRHLEVVELKNCRCIKEILNVDLGRGGEVHNLWNSLRRIRVEGCDSLVNLFPTNLLGLLDHLEEVEVERCGSIKELFNIDLGLDGEVEQVSSNLRSIRVEGCDSLVNLFPANLLDHLEEIEVNKCRSIKEIFNFDMECVGHEIERVSINLRSIRVERCDSLVNLFPIKLLGLLDHLKEVEVKKCGSIKEIFNIDFGGDGEVGHVWNSLRSIRVEGCDSLVNLFPTNPMGLLNHLKEVEVKKCGSIKEIFSIHLWGAGDFEQVSSSLRSILVEGCDSLVNLFSINPVGLVHHLEELKVKKGGSIKLIFDIDLDLVSQIEQLSRSSFRSIEVFYLEKVSREVWRMNGGENNFSLLLISGFESLERIKVEGCKGFKSVFTPTNTKFHMGALRDIVIKDCRESGRNMELVKDSHHKEIKFLSSNGRDDNVSSAAFPSNFNYLDTGNSNGLEMVFDIKNQSNRNNEEPLLPNLVGLDFSVMERMSHMWKCNNWNNFLYFQKQHQQSSFHNLTTIRIRHCKNIKYLISSHMAKLLSNLKTIQISHCDDMEEVVLKGVETYESVASTSTHANTTFFPCLHLLSFEYMRDLKRIDGGDVRDRLK